MLLINQQSGGFEETSRLQKAMAWQFCQRKKNFEKWRKEVKVYALKKWYAWLIFLLGCYWVWNEWKPSEFSYSLLREGFASYGAFIAIGVLIWILREIFHIKISTAVNWLLPVSLVVLILFARSTWSYENSIILALDCFKSIVAGIVVAVMFWLGGKVKKWRRRLNSDAVDSVEK